MFFDLNRTIAYPYYFNIFPNIVVHTQIRYKGIKKSFYKFKMAIKFFFFN